MYKGKRCDVVKSKKNPDAYTKEELVKIAEKKGITGAKSMKKEDILNKLLKASLKKKSFFIL